MDEIKHVMECLGLSFEEAQYLVVYYKGNANQAVVDYFDGNTTHILGLQVITPENKKKSPK